MSNRVDHERGHPSIFWSVPIILDIVDQADKKYLTDCEEIINKAFDCSEGMTALAKSMVKPIKISLEYQAIGHELLMADVLSASQ